MQRCPRVGPQAGGARDAPFSDCPNIEKTQAGGTRVVSSSAWGAGVEGHELPHLHISPASLSKQTSQRPLPSNPNQQHNSTSTSAQNKQTHAKHSKNHRQTKTNQNKTKHSKKHKYQDKQILQLRNSIIHKHKPTHKHTHTKAPTKKRKGRFLNKFNSKRRRLMKIALEGPPSGSAGQPRELARCGDQVEPASLITRKRNPLRGLRSKENR
jgi:hypothetical protein